MIESIVAPEARPLLSPFGQGYGALTCPTCGDACGHLFAGRRCLECEIALDERLIGAEGTTTYSCTGCGEEFEVLCAEDENGCWLTVGSDACPRCGRSGTWFDLQAEEPDRYWDADHRAPVA